MAERVEFFLWPFLFVVFSLLFLFVRKNGRSGLSPKPPPGPTPLPLLGNLLQLGHNPHRSLARLAQKHGPVMALKLGNVHTIIISSPSSARQVLQTRDHILCSRQIPDAIKNHGELSAAWMPINSNWKYLRTLMKTHLFSPRALDASQPLRQRKIRELIAFIRGQAGQPVYLGKIALCTMLNLISNSFFSMDLVDIYSDAAQGFKDLVNGLMEEGGAPNISDFFPSLALFDLQGRRGRFNLNYNKLSIIFERIIKSRLEEEEEGQVKSHDILNELLKHWEEDDSKLNLPTIKCFLIDSFVAASETSSTVVEWTMAEMIRKPELMERVRLEIKSAVGSEKEVEESDIPRLPFFNAVLKETLRLHPPVPLLPHKAEEDTEINGYMVPRGRQVLVNAWAIGRDEQVWEKPDCFIPDRFTGGPAGRSEVDFNGQHFELIPFGSGRRMCPGLPLGTRMVQLMLASLIQSFEWKLAEGMAPVDLDLQEKFGLSLIMASPLQAAGLPLVF